ncbi:16S rRNA (cytosine1402-N4)-methyltransferase [Nitratiruptor sp. YY08-26]|uniref:16S rRNA (cytosine(1402)-N(4))-methyltransferase RsmH n=1 Tax=unclassified Nitratiruptor TaxID=2624044 RepID=UPI001915ECC7|nr:MULTISPECIES: 16S rRNA (cytosine(1402)-N(4))-methyltransferase RsmH [unclassified Nitratiruptor]BCD62401.1 16S rRNA (cytosine1402-N4)-methyltransferase [Nitratiruptor sp. YY08-13]BCD66337.1 16S rRNA (cytosine1402-N4)-methyltransferase [Nitratiruptor sp. YY08-26]
MQSPHIPVLLDEVVEVFKDTQGWIVDATLGYAGHSYAILQNNPQSEIVGIDRDEEAIAFSVKRLQPFKERVKIVRGAFSQKIEEILQTMEIKGVLADIGVSSLQLDKKERGFSLESDVLDMRMDKSAALSAYEVVNEYSKEDLAKILQEYGEVKNAWKIAGEVVKHRPIKSAKELKTLIEHLVPRTKKIHPATTIFQAIRIEVNKELEELEGLLDALEKAKPKGAKVAIITFHSLEDRIVKNRFKKWAQKCICPPEALRCECGGDRALGTILTKKPITATKEEIMKNPRSRSAKLRVFKFKE